MDKPLVVDDSIDEGEVLACREEAQTRRRYLQGRLLEELAAGRVKGTGVGGFYAARDGCELSSSGRGKRNYFLYLCLGRHGDATGIEP